VDATEGIKLFLFGPAVSAFALSYSQPLLGLGFLSEAAEFRGVGNLKGSNARVHH